MAEEQDEAKKADDASERSLDALFEQLASPRRRQRQEAAHLIAEIAKTSADQLTDHIDVMIDALWRPEAQTRWETFDALSDVAKVDPDAVDGAFDGAEASLFDEESAAVRLAAFKFLACAGSTSPARSDKAWPLLDEAVQCYHGDPEYHDMLVALIGFAKGSISDAARDAMLARVAFDAKNGTGYVKSLSQEITEAAGGKQE